MHIASCSKLQKYNVISIQPTKIIAYENLHTLHTNSPKLIFNGIINSRNTISMG